jgi:hypothetical protein
MVPENKNLTLQILTGIKSFKAPRRVRHLKNSMTDNISRYTKSIKLPPTTRRDRKNLAYFIVFYTI